METAVNVNATHLDLFRNIIFGSILIMQISTKIQSRINKHDCGCYARVKFPLEAYTFGVSIPFP